MPLIKTMREFLKFLMEKNSLCEVHTERLTYRETKQTWRIYFNNYLSLGNRLNLLSTTNAGVEGFENC